MQRINKPVFLSAWAIKDWSLEDIAFYISSIKPQILEISKDFIEGEISIKKIYSTFSNLKEIIKFNISFAGTSNIVECDNFSFETYLKYLKIQFSEALFLKSTMFRLIVGPSNGLSENILISRLKKIEAFGCKPLIEIHNGWESHIPNLKALVNKTNFQFIVDFQNLSESSLSLNHVITMVPIKRIKYFHTRNLGSKYCEHPESLELERVLTNHIPMIPIMWEPKKIYKSEIKDLYYEYKQAN